LENINEIMYEEKKINTCDLIFSKTKVGCKIVIPSIKKNIDLSKIKQSLIEILENDEDIEGLENLEGMQEKVSNLKIKNNGRDGYYISLTTNRANLLKEVLKKNKEIDLGHKKIQSLDLKFVCNKNTSKILLPNLNADADELEESVKKIGGLIKLYYIDDMVSAHEKFGDLFVKCNEFITKIDYLNSCAILSLKKGYSKPVIIKQDYSYVDAVQLRHPIVERLIDYEYVPHNICVGKDELKGMLIYGLNSSGKSVLMKSVGLCVIMAQAGLYVPADSFTYSPYHSLMTRISGNDNIFKGLSSFGVEMSEINSILKRSSANTLIIGDEICRGTEHVSGNALVAATIMKLSDLKSSFIFTTHLHEIMTLDEITSIENTKAFHLKVSYDTKTESLIYDRKLTPGCGEPIYGITVAKYIIQDNDFIDNANKIKNKLLNNYNSLISGKISRYNSGMYIHECNICHVKDNVKLTNLETHHINFQKDCDENDVVKNKKHIKKNDKANLVVLCQDCHDKIHNGELTITGYVQTSKGKLLIKK
jgi:DNA mismatch repair protein MutS